MCCSKRTRLAAAAQAGTPTPSTFPSIPTTTRCSTCYKKSPCHRRNCAYAAATVQQSLSPSQHQQQQQQYASDPTAAPPSYSAAVNTADNNPTVIVYQNRAHARGPLGMAVRWGAEKVQQKRDEKKFIREFEERRSLERSGSGRTGSVGSDDGFEVEREEGEGEREGWLSEKDAKRAGLL